MKKKQPDHGTRVSFRTTPDLVEVLERTAKVLRINKRGDRYNVSAALHHILTDWKEHGLPKLAKRAS